MTSQPRKRPYPGGRTVLSPKARRVLISLVVSLVLPSSVAAAPTSDGPRIAWASGGIQRGEKQALRVEAAHAEFTVELEATAVEMAHKGVVRTDQIVLSAYHPGTGLYWWIPVHGLTAREAIENANFEFLVTEREIVSFSLQAWPNSLWLRRSSLRVESSAAGRTAVLTELEEDHGAFSRAPDSWLEHVGLDKALPVDFAIDPSTDSLVREASVVGIERNHDGWIVRLLGREGRTAKVMLDSDFRLAQVDLDPVIRRHRTSTRLAPPVPAGSEPRQGLGDSAEIHILPRTGLADHRIETIVGRRFPSTMTQADRPDALEFRVVFTNTSGRPIPLATNDEESWLDVARLTILHSDLEVPLEELEITVLEERLIRSRYLREGVDVTPLIFRPAGPLGYWEPAEAYDEVREVEVPLDGMPRTLNNYDRAEALLVAKPAAGNAFPPGDYYLTIRWDPSTRGLYLAGGPDREHSLILAFPPADSWWWTRKEF